MANYSVLLKQPPIWLLFAPGLWLQTAAAQHWSLDLKMKDFSWIFHAELECPAEELMILSSPTIVPPPPHIFFFFPFFLFYKRNLGKV